MSYLYRFFLIPFFVTAFLIISLLPRTVSAAQYGLVNILDDTVMNNTNSMSSSQIQSFLNSFPGSCLGGGFQTPRPLGYSNGSYQYSGNDSAGAAIYSIASRYNLNPQVLLATLEKEQGLVSRNGNCDYSNPAPAPEGADCGVRDSDDNPLTGPNYCSYACQNSNPVGGCVAVAVGYACPGYCNKKFNGFGMQISGASWLLRFAQARSYGQLTGYPGYDSGDENYKYRGPMTAGYRQRFAGDASVYYDGTYTDKDGNTMLVANGSTASMLNYTPFYAKSYTSDKLFSTSFRRWFGSTYSYIPAGCDSRLTGVSCVWRLYRPGDNNNFLTSSMNERDSAVNVSHFIYDSMPFYAYTSQYSGTVPVYRIRLANEHFYTTSASEISELTKNPNNSYEGIAYYAHTQDPATNLSHPIFRLNNSSGHAYTADVKERDRLINQGYTYEGIAFNAPSPFIEVVNPPANTVNIYRLGKGRQHLYTGDLEEADNLIRVGWAYEGLLLQAPKNNTNVPVFRLFNKNNDHVFTASDEERQNLINSGWAYEGVAWYTDDNTPPTYRFYLGVEHFYTTSLAEAYMITNRVGIYEGLAFGDSNAIKSNVYRLYDGNVHFFTNSLKEGLEIANKGWRYEGVAFYANTGTTGIPVYRLKGAYHFYTTNPDELNQLANKGWRYEGVAFYAN